MVAGSTPKLLAASAEIGQADFLLLGPAFDVINPFFFVEGQPFFGRWGLVGIVGFHGDGARGV
jgi:hypothetical protein